MKLRDYIYLDVDYLTSVWAQVNEGNLSNWLVESTSQEQTGNELQTEGVSHTVTADFKLLKSQVNSGTRYDKSVFSQTEIVKKAFSMALSDDIFEKVYDALSKQDSVIHNADNIKVGKYIVITGIFKILDISFLSDAVNGPLRSMLGSGPIPETPDEDMSIHQIIEILRLFTPSDVIFQHSNYISYLKRQYLREDPMTLGFKYGDKYTLFGKITKKGVPAIRRDAPKDTLLSAIEDIKEVSSSVLDAVGLKYDKHTYTIMPMAIYLE